MSKDWTPCPIDMSDLDLSGDQLQLHWQAMHLGNLEPYPQDPQLQQAWRLYHRGEFGAAVELGLELGGEGLIPAAFAGTIYAQYVEQDADSKIAIFKEVMEWCERGVDEGVGFNIHYMFAVSMGRYSQFISMIEALQQGFGGNIKEQLELLTQKQPGHAEGLVTFGGWNAEICDQAGALMGKMLYGASKDSAAECYGKAIEQAPDSPVVYIENAAGIEIMYGDTRKDETIKALETAMTKTARDAMQRLDQERAREKLATLSA